MVAPLDACLGIVLARVVEKSRAENLGPGGVGISYAAAQATAFAENVSEKYQNSDQFKKFMEQAEDALNNTSDESSGDTESVFDSNNSDEADESAFAIAEEPENASIDSPEI